MSSSVMQEPDAAPTNLVSPYGGTLIDLIEPPETAGELLRAAATLPSLQIPERAACDLELLATGAFSPLDAFMGEEAYRGVLEQMRLPDGTLYPIPVTLPVPASEPVRRGDEIALRNSRNDLLAVMNVEEIYRWERRAAAQAICGTTDLRHPLVAEMEGWGELNISGRLRVLPQRRRPADFMELRLTPAQVRARLESMGRPNVVAFQTRNPLHRAHEELTKRAIAAVDGVLLLHPAVGMTKPGDVDHHTRVRTYRVLADRYYDRDRIILSLLPLAMRMAGPREALWHATIRRNFGASHFIVGRDHAAPGSGFYGPYDAQRLASEHSGELGITVLPFEELVYLPEQDRYEERSKIAPGTAILSITGTEVREKYLEQGLPLPQWFTRPEVAQILAETHPPRHRQGVCVWFTGLSGAGKSATAEIVVELLLEHGRRTTFLDGDVVRTHLSKGLGFTKDDRDTNIRRIAFVAAEVVRHGGVAICAAVSPYRGTREEARQMVGADRFVEVFVDAPLEVCESRDAKGMYAQARAGVIRGFTGIDDPYEEPAAPELHLDSAAETADANARRVMRLLAERGFVRSSGAAGSQAAVPNSAG